MTGTEIPRSPLHLSHEVFSLFNAKSELGEILDRVLELLAPFLKCDAIGIRVMDSLGNIPYQTYRGFSDAFIAKEGHLCVRHDKCACIYIVKGEYDASLPFYIPYGSFYSNNLQGLKPLREGMGTGAFRGECVRMGWDSMAVVPIRFGHRFFGVIHVVASDSDALPPDHVELLEEIAGKLALYMNGQELAREKEAEFSALVQRVAHDLKNPLTSIKLFTELISVKHPGDVVPEEAEYIESISRNADYIEELISGLNSFSKTCGKVEPERKLIPLAEYIPALIKDMGLRDDVLMEIKVPENLPEITYPAFCLRRVLTNLISNAAKFCSKSKGPRIEVGCEGRDTYYMLSVSDNGIGISDEDVEKIFNPFYRTQDACEYPGTGLGLTICKKIVEQNGGRMWVFSERGAGSTFYFTVPKSSPGQA